MPRSASRDYADRQAGNRGYFRGWSGVERWKLYATVLAALGVVGWLAASAFYKPFDYQATRGPLASVHQAWDADCEACHRASKGANWLDARGRWNDFNCQKCHSGAPHHKAAIEGDQTCASCHHDHNGKGFSLVRMDDSHCVRCHGDLPKYTDAAEKKAEERVYAAKVTDFVKDHPEFAKPDASKRHLKFSHALHMTPGMVLQAGSASAKKLADLPAADRARYRQNDQGLVELDCKSCHQLDNAIGTRAAGAYYQPVRFETSCKACHPTEAPPVATSRGTVMPKFDVPHGLDVTELNELLKAKYSLLMQKDQPELAKHLQGKDVKASNDPRIVAFSEEVTKASHQSFDQLMSAGNGCVKCHTWNFGIRGNKGIFELNLPDKPTILQPHARFDHTAHRAMNCADCHPILDRDSVKKITGDYEREPFNLPAKANCVQCHAPRSGDTGGVRHGCTDCHNYHHGDFPLQGRGSPALAPKVKVSIDDFLKGK